MKRHLAAVGTASGAASLTGIVAYPIATAPTHVHVYWLYWVFLAGIVVGVALYFAGQERAQPAKQDDAPPPVDDSLAVQEILAPGCQAPFVESARG